MVYEKFKEVLDAIRNVDDFIDKAYKMGIDMIDSPLYSAFPTIYKPLFEKEFGEDGMEWIEWYLYELPMLREFDEKQEGKKKEKEVEKYAKDSNGDPIDVSSDEAFYEFLKKEYLIEK